MIMLALLWIKKLKKKINENFKEFENQDRWFIFPNEVIVFSSSQTIINQTI